MAPCDSHDESFAKWEQRIELQMNLENRKEILLLRAALENAQRKMARMEEQQRRRSESKDAAKEPFSSEIEAIHPTSDEASASGQLLMQIAEDIEKEALGSVAAGEGDDDTNADTELNPIKLEDPALEKELEEYRTALINALRSEEHGRRESADNITSPDENTPEQSLSASISSEGASDRRAINVRMIEAEDFSTEWDLVPALAPPPDHGLRSPIVEAILSDWTDDDGTKSALITWMENILNGSETDFVPRLKLSSLTHQIKEGFMMHVLPLLLRRKDIHVHLTSRAHRRTTYDIAVTVTRTIYGSCNNPGSCNNHEFDKILDADSESNKHHIMAFQATRSGATTKATNNSQLSSPGDDFSKTTKRFSGRLAITPGLIESSSNAGSVGTASAVTSPISNRTPQRRGMYASLMAEMKRQRPIPNLMSNASPSLVDDLSAGSSSMDSDTDSKHQSGIMERAFGLLSRRKTSPLENETQRINNGQSSLFQTPEREASLFRANLSKKKEHPHQRVVSAPPGKIGITFVEYRGHAVVSHVSEESPLVGWVFPSDVLVAIDDISVNGLNPRDIVRLLTSRARRQRSLRMASSVAMNALTQPGTV